jgi:PadR family transcriptional regulator
VIGELEQVVLLAIMRVGDEAYGVPIRQVIERDAGRRLTLGAVYTTLSRLEDKGLARSRTGDPSPQRGGRRKRYYAVTPAGQRALAASIGALRRMARGLDIGLEIP